MAEKYTILADLSTGGMGSVHLGRAHGAAGFRRLVAIKRLHRHLTGDASFVGMFVQEARLASRIRHPNVCATLDVTNEGGELRLVMDYVPGESLATLIELARKAERPVPIDVAVAILVGALEGLHAAHEACSETGEPLHIVHRDVSPQNLMVGEDGVVRVLDFGIAKAAQQMLTTQDGQIKGKIPYMSCEQVSGERVDRRTDVYAAGVVLWETLTLKPLVPRDAAHAVTTILKGDHPAPSVHRADVPAELDAVVRRALSRLADDRFPSAQSMVTALESAVVPATTRQVAAWVRETSGPRLVERARRVADLERDGAETSAAAQLAASEAPTGLPADHVAAAASPADRIPPSTKSEESGDRSVVTDTPASSPPPPRGRSTWAWVGLATLLLGVGIAGATRLAHGRDAQANDVAKVGASAPSAPVPSGAPPHEPSAALLPLPSTESSAPQASPPPTTAPAARPAASVTARPAAAVKPSCSPPFVVRDGVKRFKPECL